MQLLTIFHRFVKILKDNIQHHDICLDIISNNTHHDKIIYYVPIYVVQWVSCQSDVIVCEKIIV